MSNQNFFKHNADIFGGYFDEGDYIQLIQTNLTKVKDCIATRSNFDFKDWVQNYLLTDNLKNYKKNYN